MAEPPPPVNGLPGASGDPALAPKRVLVGMRDSPRSGKALDAGELARGRLGAAVPRLAQAGPARLGGRIRRLGQLAGHATRQDRLPSVAERPFASMPRINIS